MVEKMRKFKFLIIFTLIAISSAISYALEIVNSNADFNKYFFENKGQFLNGAEEDKILAYLKLGSSNLVFQKNSIKLYSYEKSDLETGNFESFIIFNNSNKNLEIVLEEPVNTLFNFYYPHCQLEDVRAYKRLVYKNLYDNLDLIFEYNEQNKLEVYFRSYSISTIDKLDIFIKTNTSVKTVNQELSSLELTTSSSKFVVSNIILKIENPKSGQSAYKLVLQNYNNDSYSLKKIEEVNTLIQKEPYIYNAVYFGGLNDDQLWRIKKDKNNRVVAIGGTNSSNFIPRETSEGDRYKSDYDCFIARYNKTLEPSFVTFFGGGSYDAAWDLDIDTINNSIIIVGETKSFDLPVSQNAYQKSLKTNNKSDAFVLSLDLFTGKRKWATYFGGEEEDFGYAVALGKNFNINIGGQTNSTKDFPLKSAFQNIYQGGDSDGFIAVLNPDGSTLVFSSYIGGNREDAVSGLVSDSKLNVMGVGWTNSDNFYSPAGNDPYQKSLRGDFDGFIIKFTDNKDLVYSTYFGGSDYDEFFDVDINNKDEIIISGLTFSNDFPRYRDVMNFGFQNKFAGILVKFKSDKPDIVWSTYLTNNSTWNYHCKVMDVSINKSNNNIYIAGYGIDQFRFTVPFLIWAYDDGRYYLDFVDDFTGDGYQYISFGNSVSFLEDGLLMYGGKTAYKEPNQVNVLENGNAFLWLIESAKLSVEGDKKVQSFQIVSEGFLQSGIYYISDANRLNYSELIIFDILGNLIGNYGNLNSLTYLDLSKQPNGIYLIVALKEDKIIGYQKILR